MADAEKTVLYPEVLLYLKEAISIEWQLEKQFVKNNVAKRKTKALVSLESSVLDLAAYEECSAVVFLVVQLHIGNDLILRFFENENCLGFMQWKGQSILSSQSERSFCYRTFTTSDIQKRNHYLSARRQSISNSRKKDNTTYHQRNRTGQVYKRLVKSCENNLKDLCNGEEGVIKGIFMQCIRNCTSNRKLAENVFTYGWGLEKSVQDILEMDLSEFLELGQSCCETFEDLCIYNDDEYDYGCDQEYSNLPVSKQFILLSLIPNYHYETCPKVGSHLLKKSTSSIGYFQHIAFQEVNPGKNKPAFLPSSVRNRFIYFTMNNMFHERNRVLDFLYSPTFKEPLQYSRSYEYNIEMPLKSFERSPHLSNENKNTEPTFYQSLINKVRESSSKKLKLSSSANVTVKTEDVEDTNLVDEWYTKVYTFDNSFINNDTMNLKNVSNGDEKDQDHDYEIEEYSDQVTLKEHFSPLTGEWNFECYSKHKPVPQDSEELCTSKEKRYNICDANTNFKRNQLTGSFQKLGLLSQLKDSCKCGAGFISEMNPTGKSPVDFRGVLYMDHGPVEYAVYKRECLQVNSPCVLEYNGSQDHIHFLNKHVAAGDEIGWEFCNCVVSSKITFSEYCEYKTSMYQSTHPLASFMNEIIFKKWFFSWASNMKIDFRQETDPWCTPNPKKIACLMVPVSRCDLNMQNSAIDEMDGDQITVSAQNTIAKTCLLNPEKVTCEDVNGSELHLKYICRKYSGDLKPCDFLAEDEETQMNSTLLDMCATDNRCKTLLTKFIKGYYPSNVQSTMANFFELLSEVKPITEVIPFRYVSILEEIVEILIIDPTISFKKIKLFCPELFQIFEKTLGHNFFGEISDFVLYLCNFIKSVHNNDDRSQTADPIANTYNPQLGVAYYFTKHGNKLRNLNKYRFPAKVSVTTFREHCKTVTNDDERVHLFVSFCPTHGHCLGFHISDASESLEDSFRSVYLYMEEPPEDVYSDIACKLSDYCLKREPEFWRSTQFWNYTSNDHHTCGKIYNSSRISSKTINSEILKEFKEFMERVMNATAELSQSQFCFFVQLMIFIWNRKRNE